jgi:hypothetical protein
MRSSLFVGCALVGLVACTSSTDDSESSTQDQTAVPVMLDGETVTYPQLSEFAPLTGPTSAVILFPTVGDPAFLGQLVAGGKVSVIYALNRLSQCRASHNGFQIWDTRIGGEFSNGTKIGEERASGSGAPPEGSVRGFAGSSSTGQAHTVPFTFDVPAGADWISLYAHNTSPAGPAAACDTYDSKLGANFRFKIDANSAAGVSEGSNATADALAPLVDLSDGSNTAAILFGTSGEPVLKGTLVQGGRVFVVYALDRLRQCRALHDGFPYWNMDVGGSFSEGTKVGGTAVRFASIPGTARWLAQSLPTAFDVPATANDLELYVHNWNPGGPVSACSGYDSRNGANYHFAIRSR